MSDHAILALGLVVSIVVGVTGLLILGSMLRECQRLTRAVAGMICQESANTRAVIAGRSQA